MKSFGVHLLTIELAINNQSFQVTQPDNPDHYQLRTNDALWYKENLINIATRRSPPECVYIAWIDAEMQFLNLNWVEETKQALKPQTNQLVATVVSFPTR
jgi:hypothetical protein